MKFKWINPKYALVRVKDDMDVAKMDESGVVKWTIHSAPKSEESYSADKYVIEHIAEIIGVQGRNDNEDFPVKVGDQVWLMFSWFSDARQDNLIMSSGNGFIEALVPLHNIICAWADGSPVAIRDEIIVMQDKQDGPKIHAGLWMYDKDRRKSATNQVWGEVVSVGSHASHPGWFQEGIRVLYNPLNATKIEHKGKKWHRVGMDDVLLKEVPDA